MNIESLIKEVERRFAHGTQAGHGMDHALRTARLARHIAEREGYDLLEAEVAGLLHDVGRTVQKEEKDHGPAGVPLAGQLLNTFTDYNEVTKKRILAAVRDHSAFKAQGKLTHIVQDADKLEGLGAIGVARGYLSRPQLPLYDPADMLPGKAARDTTAQAHFMWLLEWVDMMETKTGRTLAKKRGAFMANFMRQIAHEANGEDL